MTLFEHFTRRMLAWTQNYILFWLRGFPARTVCVLYLFFTTSLHTLGNLRTTITSACMLMLNVHFAKFRLGPLRFVSTTTIILAGALLTGETLQLKMVRSLLTICVRGHSRFLASKTLAISPCKCLPLPKKVATSDNCVRTIVSSRRLTGRDI